MNHASEFSQDVRSDSLIKLGGLLPSRDTSLFISGKNSSFVAEDEGWFRNCRFRIESDESSIHFGKGVVFSGSIFLKGAGPNHVYIGPGTSCGQANIICGEGSAVRIGSDCMLSWGIEIRTTDSHAIFDIENGARINPAEDIGVGDHVWIAAKAMLLKGSTIPDGCVVGMAAITSRHFDERNVVISGNPARIVRSGVRWERPLLG